jgi:hypothetical protein
VKHSKNIASVLLLLAPCLPSSLNLPFFASAYILFALCIFQSPDLLKSLYLKILLIALVLPCAFNFWFNSSFDIIRLLPFLLLILGYPYTSLTDKLPFALLKDITIVILLYITTTQILLILGNPQAILYRDLFYPVSDNILENTWDYGSLDMQSALTSFGRFRAGGLWRNPNVLASLSFFYLTAYYSIYINLKPDTINSPTFLSKNKNLIFIASLPTFLTLSRTYIFAVVLFLFCFYWGSFLRTIATFKVNIKTLIILAFSIVFLTYSIFILSDRIANSVTSDSSLFLKNEILFDYIHSSSIFDLFFGSSRALVNTIQFDAEFGYWLGSGGFLALSSIILFYLIFNQASHSFAYPIILPVLFAGFGNTQLYGLLTSTLILFTLPLALGGITRSFNVIHPYH